MAVPDLRKQLERKATFEPAVKALRVQLQQPSTQEADLEQLLDCCSRVNTLLKARYSNVGFWKAGLELYRAAIVSVGISARCSASCHASSGIT